MILYQWDIPHQISVCWGPILYVAMACIRHPMSLSFLGQQCIWMNKHSTWRLKVWIVNDEGNALRNYFTLHWSTKAIKEALEKDNVIRTSFRVNTYHRLNAHCAIDGVKTKALVSGLASHTTCFILENQHSSCHFSHYPTFILPIPILPTILYTYFSFPVCMKPMHVPLLLTPHLTMSPPSFLYISPLPTITVTPPHSISTIIPIIPPHNRILHTHFLPMPISYLHAWESCMHAHSHGHIPITIPETMPTTFSLSTPHAHPLPFMHTFIF